MFTCQWIKSWVPSIHDSSSSFTTAPKHSRVCLKVYSSKVVWRYFWLCYHIVYFSDNRVSWKFCASILPIPIELEVWLGGQGEVPVCPMLHSHFLVRSTTCFISICQCKTGMTTSHEQKVSGEKCYMYKQLTLSVANCSLILPPMCFAHTLMSSDNMHSLCSEILDQMSVPTEITSHMQQETKIRLWYR